MATTITTTVRQTGGDYATFSIAAADNYGATSQDLVTNDEALVCEMGNDWSGDGLEDFIRVMGFTTDATRNITIRAMSGHGTDGTIGSGARIWQPNTSVTSCLDIFDEHVYIGGQGRGIEAQNQRSNQGTMFPRTNCSNCTVDSCLLSHPTLTSSAIVFFNSTGNTGNRFRNCVFLANGTYSSVYIIKFEGSGTIENCHIINDTTNTFSQGFWVRASSAWTVKNCVVAGSGTITTEYLASGYTASSTHNATQNATDNAPGGNSQIGISSADFVDEVDYVPSASGKLQAGNGADLSSDFNYDISGASRGGSFTIGAFNQPASGGNNEKVNEVTNPAKVSGVANPAKVLGIET